MNFSEFQLWRILQLIYFMSPYQNEWRLASAAYFWHMVWQGLRLHQELPLLTQTWIQTCFGPLTRYEETWTCSSRSLTGIFEIGVSLTGLRTESSRQIGLGFWWTWDLKLALFKHMNWYWLSHCLRALDWKSCWLTWTCLKLILDFTPDQTWDKTALGAQSW